MPKRGVMQATQTQIARRCGLDVSSVNKILNRIEGPVFRKETVQKVFRIAREIGYDLDRASKGRVTSALRDLYEVSRKVLSSAAASGVPVGVDLDELQEATNRVGRILKS